MIYVKKKEELTLLYMLYVMIKIRLKLNSLITKGKKKKKTLRQNDINR